MGPDTTDTMTERPGTQPSMDMKNVAVGPSTYVPELHWQILVWRSPPYIREPMLGDGWR